MVGYGGVAVSRPVIVVTSRRSPHKVAWLLYSILAGVSLLSARDASSALAGQQRGLLYLWAGLLVGSALLGLYSVLRRGNVERSMGYEQAAMLINAAALLWLAVAVLAVAGASGWVAVATAAIFAGAGLARAWQIRRDLRWLRNGRARP